MAADAQSGALTKLTIKAFDTPDYSGRPVGTFTAHFNPEEYAQVYEAQFDKKSADGSTGSPMRYKNTQPQEYTFSFVLDGTGATGPKIDVALKLAEFLSLTGFDGSLHRPRYLWILWGALSSRCVLHKAETTFKLFRPNGTPLRAVINATFTENIDDATRAQKENKTSPDLTHERVTREGDTLPLLASDIYGDAALYVKIARRNRLNHFRRLAPGTRLVFPPLAELNRE